MPIGVPLGPRGNIPPPEGRREAPQAVVEPLHEADDFEDVREVPFCLLDHGPRDPSDRHIEVVGRAEPADLIVVELVTGAGDGVVVEGEPAADDLGVQVVVGIGGDEVVVGDDPVHGVAEHGDVGRGAGEERVEAEVDVALEQVERVALLLRERLERGEALGIAGETEALGALVVTDDDLLEGAARGLGDVEKDEGCRSDTGARGGGCGPAELGLDLLSQVGIDVGRNHGEQAYRSSGGRMRGLRGLPR